MKQEEITTPMASAQPTTSLLLDIATAAGGVYRMDLLKTHRSKLQQEAATLKRQSQMGRYWSKIEALESLQRLIDEERDGRAS